MGLSVEQAEDVLFERLAHEHHLNLLWVVNADTDQIRSTCGIAARYGLGVVATLPGVNALRARRPVSAAEIDAVAGQAAEAFRGVDALRGWALIDEPRAEEAPGVEAMRRALARHDPDHPALAVSTKGAAPAIAEGTHLDFLVTDAYEFGSPRDVYAPRTPGASRSSFRSASEHLTQIARSWDRIPWIMPQAFSEVWGRWWEDENGDVVVEPGSYWHWRTPTPAESTWQAWQALIAGHRGVVFFVLLPPQNAWTPGQPVEAAGMLFRRGERLIEDGLSVEDVRRPTGQPAALLRSDGRSTPALKALGVVFETTRRLWTEHGPWLPSEVPLAFFDPPVHGATFRLDRSPERRLVLLVNDDTEAAHAVNVQFPAKVSAVTLLPQDRSLALAPGMSPGSSSATVDLDPGAGLALLVDLDASTRPVKRK